MRVFVFGTRGVPDIQGGVERHCEYLYSKMSDKCKITVFRRKPYIKNNNLNSWKNIDFIDLSSTKIKGIEAIVHSFLCTFISIIKYPNIVHIHNIGPGIFTPLLRLFGLKVVITYHSPNYEHAKWGIAAKKILLLGELFSLKYANRIIFVNQKQREKFTKKTRDKSAWIPNGVENPIKSTSTDYINSLGLQPQQYLLTVGRMTQEKGFDYLIDAYKELKSTNCKLVIAGSADHETAFSKKVVENAKANNVVLTGFVTGEDLNQLFTHARLFILPSFHEGLPIALLEAMSYDLEVLVSDIPANKSVNLPEDCYFETGNKEALARKLEERINSEYKNPEYNMDAYNWDKIAEQVYRLYKDVMYTNK